MPRRYAPRNDGVEWILFPGVIEKLPIFANPVQANIIWHDIEALLIACGALKQEGRGSRVRFLLNNVIAVFHRPHPQKETDKGAVKSVRKFLIDAGVIPT